MARILPTLLVGASLAQPAAAQGVPTFDAEAFARTAALITQRDRDIALQEDRLTREQELAEIERQQLAALESILEATTTGSYAAVAGTVAALEAGTEEETGIAAVYPTEDDNPAAARLFGDARETVEELIIRAARDTYSHPGVAAAGLTPVQWR